MADHSTGPGGVPGPGASGPSGHGGVPGDAPHTDVAGYVLGTLDPRERAAFEVHLSTCAACRAEVAELDSLPSLLGAAAEPPPDALRRRTFDAIAAAARDDAGPARAPAPGPHSGQPAGSPAPPAGPPAGIAGGRPVGGGARVVPLRPRRTARVLVAAAAALVVAAAVAIGAVALTRGGADTTTIALAAGDVGSARGEAVVRDVEGGREVELTVSGLPPSEPGSFYECWFVGPGDTEESPNRVSAGTFTVGRDGTATVTLLSAADAERFPKLGVTLEPDDGNPARTGPKFLVTP